VLPLLSSSSPLLGDELGLDDDVGDAIPASLENLERAGAAHLDHWDPRVEPPLLESLAAMFPMESLDRVVLRRP